MNRHDDWYNRNQVVLCSKISSSKEFKNGAPRICDAQRTHGTKSRCGGWDTFLHTLDHQSVTDLDIYSQLGTFGCECDQSFKSNFTRSEPAAFRRYCFPVVHGRDTESPRSIGGQVFCDCFPGQWIALYRDDIYLCGACRRIDPG